MPVLLTLLVLTHCHQSADDNVEDFEDKLTQMVGSLSKVA